ncbi:N-acetylneuraminate synthase family protein [Aestuariibacter salexigens]|uniref:N-acetylneuraminate synthase family protein n=1 Tax=Aestuariibacter salexigens TaxID=226010 RepID=UPI00047EBEF5|nr:N-acetylneuraminate synthase family protein [Aestuariibacter salexigens]
MTNLNLSHLIKPLVIFEMANNHMGDFEHGLNIIKAYGALKRNYETQLDFAFKFQYRDLDTFIHRAHKGSSLKYIKRFEQTRLTDTEWRALNSELDEYGFIRICTPFDEKSVKKVVRDEFDVIKIASCSFTDWPLLEEVSKANKPVIASVAGCSDDDISNVAAFFAHRDIEAALLYCVGMYPTSADNLNVAMIQELKRRYPHLTIGFSTHEDPSETAAVAVAVGAGARIFEKHVALPTENYEQNLYSTDLKQTEAWLESLTKALTVYGTVEGRRLNLDEENKSLRPLKRGVFLKNDAPSGTVIGEDEFYFAIPAQEDALVANDISKFKQIELIEPIAQDEALPYARMKIHDERQKVLNIRNKIRQLVSENSLIIPQKARLEISHHYGLDEFDCTGLCMVTILNNANYCKKLLFLFPGQSHPEQFHKIKHETFIVLSGQVCLILDDTETLLNVGDVVQINPGQRHAFSSTTGAVIEEISTQSTSDDSYYTDEKINKTEKRKSYVEMI